MEHGKRAIEEVVPCSFEVTVNENVDITLNENLFYLIKYKKYY